MIAVRVPSITLLVLILFSQSVSAAGLASRIKTWLLAPPTKAAAGMGQVTQHDVTTEQCMQCHNGSHGRQITTKGADEPMQFNSVGKQVNHPVGMDYQTYAGRKPGSYVHPAMLNPRVRLVNGQVGCVSCHQSRPTQLAMAGSPIQSDALQQPLAQVDTNQCQSTGQLTTGPDKNDLCAACHTM